MNTDTRAVIAGNVARVRERMARAAERSGRRPEEVRLVAVTKYVGAEATRAVVAAGCRDLGESRPQQLWAKADALAAEPVRWHLIGHLQRNKVRRTLPLLDLLHSLDSARLAEAVAEESDAGPPRPVLLEVNVSGDASKHGLAPQEVGPLLRRLADNPAVRMRGLMGMAGRDPRGARADFARLRRLRDALRPECPPGASLDELSMGMSGDFEEAIAEGATLVRIGSLLFEGMRPEAGSV